MQSIHDQRTEKENAIGAGVKNNLKD